MSGVLFIGRTRLADENKGVLQGPITRENGKPVITGTSFAQGADVLQWRLAYTNSHVTARETHHRRPDLRR